MTEKEIKEFDELYEYIRIDIMGYDKTIPLPKYFVMRLKGLSKGKFISSGDQSPLYTYYSFLEIMYTFKLNKGLIVNAFKTKSFKDESHKINYMMLIVEKDINNIKTNLIRKQKQQEESKRLNIDNQASTQAEYKRRSKDVTNDRLKDLIWKEET